MTQLLSTLPQIYIATFVFFVILAAYLWTAVAGADPSVVATLAKMVEALFYALIGGFALGQRGTGTTVHAERAHVTGPLQSDMKTGKDKPV